MTVLPSGNISFSAFMRCVGRTIVRLLLTYGIKEDPSKAKPGMPLSILFPMPDCCWPFFYPIWMMFQSKTIVDCLVLLFSRPNLLQPLLQVVVRFPVFDSM